MTDLETKGEVMTDDEKRRWTRHDLIEAVGCLLMVAATVTAYYCTIYYCYYRSFR